MSYPHCLSKLLMTGRFSNNYAKEFIRKKKTIKQLKWKLSIFYVISENYIVYLCTILFPSKSALLDLHQQNI